MAGLGAGHPRNRLIQRRHAAFQRRAVAGGHRLQDFIGPRLDLAKGLAEQRIAQFRDGVLAQPPVRAEDLARDQPLVLTPKAPSSKT